MPKAQHNSIQKLIMVASSTGGTRVLREVFGKIGNLDAAVVISQHLVENGDRLLRDGLSRFSGCEAIIPIESEQITSGKIYISPCNSHLHITNDLRVHLSQDPPVNYVRPSADVTMMSVPRNTGIKILAVVLTGIGQDGAEGAKYIKSIGGKVIVQSPSTCVINEMPSNTIKNGCVDAAMDPATIRQTLINFAGKAQNVVTV